MGDLSPRTVFGCTSTHAAQLSKDMETYTEKQVLA